MVLFHPQIIKLFLPTDHLAISMSLRSSPNTACTWAARGWRTVSSKGGLSMDWRSWCPRLSTLKVMCPSFQQRWGLTVLLHLWVLVAPGVALPHPQQRETLAPHFSSMATSWVIVVCQLRQSQSYVLGVFHSEPKVCGCSEIWIRLSASELNSSLMSQWVSGSLKSRAVLSTAGSQ